MKIYAIFLLISFTGLGIVSASNGSVVASENNPRLQPFILGGNVAEENEFPWLVFLAITNKDETISRCGGTLIKMAEWNLKSFKYYQRELKSWRLNFNSFFKNQVLTAAHCVVKAKFITISAGSSRLGGYLQQRKSKIFRLHENYHVHKAWGFPVNDIAVIYLQHPFRHTQGVIMAISLPRPDDIISSTSRGTVLGWGKTTEGGAFSNVLLKVNVPIVTDSSCTKVLVYWDTQFCAGSLQKDACEGDSGGAFICSDMPNRLCGIVSYGYGCGRPGSPGVYTKVSAYVNWIDGRELPATAIIDTSTASPMSAPVTFSILFYCLSYFFYLFHVFY